MLFLSYRDRLPSNHRMIKFCSQRCFLLIGRKDLRITPGEPWRRMIVTSGLNTCNSMSDASLVARNQLSSTQNHKPVLF